MSVKGCNKSFVPARDGWRQLWSIVAYVAFTTVVGCSWLPETRGLLEKRHPETRINSGQLRLWTNDFILDYADQIEEAADRIKEQEPSAEIKRNTLLWKINATQAGFRAASQRDALMRAIKTMKLPVGWKFERGWDELQLINDERFYARRRSRHEEGDEGS